MPRFIFNITLMGAGDTPEDAWKDAVDQLAIDPGPMPDEYYEDDEE